MYSSINRYPTNSLPANTAGAGSEQRRAVLAPLDVHQNVVLIGGSNAFKPQDFEIRDDLWSDDDENDTRTMVVAADFLEEEEATPTALLGLGNRFFNGAGVAQYDEMAVRMYKMAASGGKRKGDEQQTGVPEAIFGVARSYYYGLGVEPNHTRALHLFERAGELGLVEGLYNAAVMHGAGDGCVRDRARAAGLFVRAADMGDVNAMWRAAKALSGEDGVARNEEAFSMYIRAAEAGHVDAMFCLGQHYVKEGHFAAKEDEESEWKIDQDLDKALHWFASAAEQGDEDSLLVAQILTNHREAVEASSLTDVTADVVIKHMMGGN